MFKTFAEARQATGTAECPYTTKIRNAPPAVPLFKKDIDGFGDHFSMTFAANQLYQGGSDPLLAGLPKREESIR